MAPGGLSPEEALAALAGHDMEVVAGGSVAAHGADFLLFLRLPVLTAPSPKAQHAGAAAAAAAALPIRGAEHGGEAAVGRGESATGLGSSRPHMAQVRPCHVVLP